MKHEKLYAKVFTSNNYRDLNDQYVEVDEFIGQLVAVKIFDPATGKMQIADLRLSEVREFTHTLPDNTFIQR